MGLLVGEIWYRLDDEVGERVEITAVDFTPGFGSVAYRSLDHPGASGITGCHTFVLAFSPWSPELEAE